MGCMVSSREQSLKMEREDQGLHVLHVTFNLDFGGTEQVIAQLVRGLPRDRFRSVVACIDGRAGPMAAGIRDSGGKVVELGRRSGIDWALVRSLRRVIREEHIDVVHGHQYTPWFYACLASMGTGVRIVFTEHGRFYPDRYRWKAAWLNPILAFRSQAIVAISKATRRALSTYEFIPRSRIQVIYNGIEPLMPRPGQREQGRGDLGIPENAFVLGTVARLDPVKNQGMLMTAAARLMHRCPDVWLVLVGDGPERVRLEQRADQLGIADRTVFTGFQPNPGDFMQLMDVFLLTSWTEGTSMTLLEAMSLGVPCVATAVGGNPEIVLHGETGHLVPCDDVEALHQTLWSLRQSPGQLKVLGQQGAARFRAEFTVDAMVARYVRLYHHDTPGNS